MPNWQASPPNSDWPRVTEIIGATLIDDWHGGQYAMDRGTAVHRACELWDRGKLNEETVDEAVEPYLEGYKAFVDSSSYTPLYIEQEGANFTLQYRGTIDRICLLNGAPHVLDIKTGQFARWHAIQLAAYRELAMIGTDFEEMGRAALYLPGDGAFRLEVMPVVRHLYDWQVFKAALAVYKWKGAA